MTEIQFDFNELKTEALNVGVCRPWDVKLKQCSTWEEFLFLAGRPLPEVLYLFSRWIRKAPYPEAEPVIKDNPLSAHMYAKYVKKARWPEAEAVIMSKHPWDGFYKEYISLLQKGF